MFEQVKQEYKYTNEEDYYDELLAHVVEKQFRNRLAKENKPLWTKVQKIWNQIVDFFKKGFNRKSLIKLSREDIEDLSLEDMKTLVERDITDPYIKKFTRLETTKTVVGNYNSKLVEPHAKGRELS